MTKMTSRDDVALYTEVGRLQEGTLFIETELIEGAQVLVTVNFLPYYEAKTYEMLDIYHRGYYSYLCLVVDTLLETLQYEVESYADYKAL